MARWAVDSGILPPSAGDACPTSISSAHWAEGEINEAAFKDARLGRRCTELLKQIGDAMGESIPYACQDWANTVSAHLQPY